MATLQRFRTHQWVSGLLAPWALLPGSPASGQVLAETPTLAPVEVRASRQPDATSEGSGSYVGHQVTVGGKEALSPLDIPHAVSVITRQRIEDQGLTSAEEALREVTGVTVTPWDGATFQIRSRGYFLEPSYDGIPSFDGLNATQQLDLAAFDRVEVLRGPAGLFHGSGQPGGTVNFARRKGLPTFGGSAAVSLGSWSYQRVEAEMGGPLNADGSLRSRIVLAGHDRGFYYERAQSRKQMVYGTLDYDLSPRTTLSLYGAFQDDKTNPFSGLPAYTNGRFIPVPRSTNPYPSWNVYDTTTTWLAAEAAHRADNGWTFRARYSFYRQDWDLRDSYPTAGVNPTTGLMNYARRGWDTQGTRHLLDLYATGPFTWLGRQHQLTAGWNAVRYDSDTDYGANDTVVGVPFLQPDVVPSLTVPPFVRGYQGETRQSGWYAQTRLTLTDTTTLLAGARLSDFQARSRNTLPGAPIPAWTPGAQTSGQITPYAGLVQHLGESVTAYVSYADIFIPQTQREVSGRVIDPRVGAQVEVGAKASWLEGRLQAAVAAFRTRDRNRAFPDVANPGFFVQVGEVEINGWEAELTGSPIPNLQLSVGYSRLNTRYSRHQTLTGTPFTLFEPRHSLKAYANYRFSNSPWSVGGGLHITSGLIGTGQAGVREQAGLGVASLQVGYRIDQRSSVSLSINNLTDRTYYARVGGLNTYNTYGDPRNAMLTYRVKF